MLALAGGATFDDIQPVKKEEADQTEGSDTASAGGGGQRERLVPTAAKAAPPEPMKRAGAPSFNEGDAAVEKEGDSPDDRMPSRAQRPSFLPHLPLRRASSRPPSFSAGLSS